MSYVDQTIRSQLKLEGGSEVWCVSCPLLRGCIVVVLFRGLIALLWMDSSFHESVKDALFFWTAKHLPGVIARDNYGVEVCALSFLHRLTNKVDYSWSWEGQWTWILQRWHWYPSTVSIVHGFVGTLLLNSRLPTYTYKVHKKWNSTLTNSPSIFRFGSDVAHSNLRRWFMAFQAHVIAQLCDILHIGHKRRSQRNPSSCPAGGIDFQLSCMTDRWFCTIGRAGLLSKNSFVGIHAIQLFIPCRPSRGRVGVCFIQSQKHTGKALVLILSWVGLEITSELGRILLRFLHFACFVMAIFISSRGQRVSSWNTTHSFTTFF